MLAMGFSLVTLYYKCFSFWGEGSNKFTYNFGAK